MQQMHICAETSRLFLVTEPFNGNGHAHNAHLPVTHHRFGNSIDNPHWTGLDRQMLLAPELLSMLP